MLSGAGRWHVEHGSMLDVLPLLPENSADSCVCDPPYELSFMGRKWDGSGIAFRPETWAAVLRVLKPGAHILAFGGSRTAHRIACAIEDAGFEIRDEIFWAYGSGFPKSKNLGHGFGTALKPGHEPIIVARKPIEGTTTANHAKWGTGGLNIDGCRVAHASPSDLAAHEAQVKAIKERGGSMAESWKNSSDLSGANDVSSAGRWPPNVAFTHSAGCKAVGSRAVKANPTWDTPNRETKSGFTGEEVSAVRHVSDVITEYECAGDCPVRALDEQSGESFSSGHVRANGEFKSQSKGRDTPHNTKGVADAGTASRFFPQTEWCPQLDDATRFLYEPKAPRAERDAGLESFRKRSGAQSTNRKEGQASLQSPRSGAGRKGGMRNPHPTVKPVGILRWCTRLVTPPRGLVLDPFAGSGSCGIAAMLEGLRYLGIELNDSEAEPFASVARARIEWVIGGDYSETKPAPHVDHQDAPKQGSLFR